MLYVRIDNNKKSREVQIHTSVCRSTGNKFMAPVLNENPLKRTHRLH